MSTITSTLTITYTPWIKNKARGGTKWYVRVREKGRKAYDIALNTTDKSVAENWCALRRKELEMHNNYVMAGETPPVEVRQRIVTTDNRDTAPVTVEKALEMYLAHCRGRGLRAATCDDYDRTLHMLFRDRLGDRFDLTRDFIRNVMSSYSHLAQQTRRSYGYYLRGFFRWWIHRVDGNDKLLEEIVPVKIDRKPHVFWTKEEMERLYAVAPDTPTKAFWMVMGTVGCRQGELTKATWGDINGNQLTLRGENTKTRVTRIVPLSPTVMELLETFRGDKEARIFQDVLSTNSGRNQQLQRHCALAGIPRGTLHTFRHSCAMHYFKHGLLDIKDVAALLGHASETTTLQIYLEATRADELTSKVLSVI